MIDTPMDALALPDPLIAVVGASDIPTKYGAIIYRDLKGKGYRVVAVNPNRDTVDGDPAHPDLASLPERPDVIDYVVPPEITLKVLGEADRLGMRTAWVQPGAGSPEVRRFLEEHGFVHLVDDCIMVRTGGRSDDL